MFTGIIEGIGEVEKMEREGSNLNFTIKSSFTNELKIDQSVAHSGCCLTVVEILGDSYVVNAIDETLENLGETMKQNEEQDKASANTAKGPETESTKTDKPAQ